MKNKYPGVCYHCGAGVAKRAGRVKPTGSRDPNAYPKWYIIHDKCLKARAKLADKQNKAEKAEKLRTIEND